MANPKPTVLPTVIQDRANGKSRIAALPSGDSRQSSKKLPYCLNFYRVPRASPLKTCTNVLHTIACVCKLQSCTNTTRLHAKAQDFTSNPRRDPAKGCWHLFSSLSGRTTGSLSLATAGHAPARRIRQLNIVMPEQKADVSKPQQPVKPMEDDDEFEEFDVEGTNHSCAALQDCCESLPEPDMLLYRLEGGGRGSRQIGTVGG